MLLIYSMGESNFKYLFLLFSYYEGDIGCVKYLLKMKMIQKIKYTERMILTQNKNKRSENAVQIESGMV